MLARRPSKECKIILEYLRVLYKQQRPAYMLVTSDEIVGANQVTVGKDSDVINLLLLLQVYCIILSL